MNKVSLKRTGNLEINGVEIQKVLAVGIQSNGTDSPTMTIKFDVDEFDIAMGLCDFTQAIDLDGEMTEAGIAYIKGMLERRPELTPSEK